MQSKLKDDQGLFYPRHVSAWCVSKRKRLLGLVCGVIALILVAPLMLLIGLLIKITSKGPVLFRQERVGLHQQPFIILKFRTIDHYEEEADRGLTVTRHGDPRMAGDFSVLQGAFVRFRKTPSVACAGYTQPTFDFGGSEIQNMDDMTTPFSITRSVCYQMLSAGYLLAPRDVHHKRKNRGLLDCNDECSRVYRMVGSDGSADAYRPAMRQGTTLGVLAKSLEVWPHATVGEALSKLYGFCSDYPGIRHSGNPAGQLRELNLNDALVIPMLLVAFSGYLVDVDIDEILCPRNKMAPAALLASSGTTVPSPGLEN